MAFYAPLPVRFLPPAPAPEPAPGCGVCAALDQQRGAALAAECHAKAARCNAELRNHPHIPGNGMVPAGSPARLDVKGMLADAGQLLAAGAEGPTDDGLSELTLRLRGHIMLLIPAVSDRIAVHPRNDDPLAQAMAAVARAGRRLAEEAPNGSVTQAVAYAQRLAHTVVTLTEHLTALEDPR